MDNDAFGLKCALLYHTRFFFQYAHTWQTKLESGMKRWYGVIVISALRRARTGRYGTPFAGVAFPRSLQGWQAVMRVRLVRSVPYFTRPERSGRLRLTLSLSNVMRRCGVYLALHGVSDSSSIWRPNMVWPRLSGGIETGGMSDPGDTATRDEKR